MAIEVRNPPVGGGVHAYNGSVMLDDEVCYRAHRSRDPRFDGRFFVGVTSTGIYCRPICPARPAKREHLRYFTCAAAAEEAGFRACRRCRPETAPGTPAWNGPSSLVSRALRLIAEGGLDHGGVEALAARLGVGSRHLRRLFDRHVGASPLAVARTRRVHFARTLLDATTLPMATVSRACGFGSVRQFNDSIRSSFGRTPSQLRRAATRPAPGFALRLSYRPPLDWTGLLDYLGTRAVPGVESVERGIWRRAVRSGGRSGHVQVRSAGDGRHLLLETDLELDGGALDLVQRVRRLFDLDADPAAIAEELTVDRWIGPRLARRTGLRVPGCWDGFELAVRAVLGQQVTVRGATTLASRLVERLGDPCDGGGRLFPTPQRVADADLSWLGVPVKRQQTLRALASEVATGRLALSPSSDPAEVAARISAIPGIGPWTVQYVLLRAIRDPDAFPAGDLGLRKAAGRPDRPMTERALASRSELWRPWRAYAAFALWMDPSPAGTETAGLRRHRTATARSSRNDRMSPRRVSA